MSQQFSDEESGYDSDCSYDDDPFWNVRGPRNEEEFRRMPPSMRVWGTAFNDFPSECPRIPDCMLDETGHYSTILRANSTPPVLGVDGDEENEGESLFLHRDSVQHPNIYEWYRPNTFAPSDPLNGPDVGYMHDAWMANMHHVSRGADPSLDEYFGDLVRNRRPPSPYEEYDQSLGSPRLDELCATPAFDSNSSDEEDRRLIREVMNEWRPRRWDDWIRSDEQSDSESED